ncbi:MAG: LytTR family DNA-binding domain-containing protein [Burkholderiales bacterium]|nr:LytTR family DNA-binding domain-containing protein [Burkholderiales bacterium]
MSGPLRVFIADDEQPARERLKALLEDIAAEVPTAIAGEAADGVQTLERLPAARADVLLLDIQMPGMSGLEVARHAARLAPAPAVIFVTAHDRHAIEAFEVAALDYLLKPVRAPRLAAALRKAAAAGPIAAQRLARAGPAREYFSVAARQRILLVPVREVIYLKAEHKYVTLRPRAGEHLIEESLVQLEREFADRFVRIHRNCLVARAAIRGFERAGGEQSAEAHWEVVLEGVPERLPVSRRQWAAVREALGEARRG